MLVIGGKNSSNTKKLYNICKSYCENTFAIETVDDIDFSVFDSQDVVGVTAGASTPDWIIKEVIEKMNVFDENSKERINEAINETQKVVNDTETAEEKNIKADETQQVDSNKESNHAGITIEETSEETISEEKSDNEITAESDNDSANENVETTEKTEKTTDEVTTMEGFEETMVS